MCKQVGTGEENVRCDQRVSVRTKELREIQAAELVVVNILRFSVGVMG